MWTMQTKRQIICPMMTLIALKYFGARLQAVKPNMTHIISAKNVILAPNIRLMLSLLFLGQYCCLEKRGILYGLVKTCECIVFANFNTQHKFIPSTKFSLDIPIMHILLRKKEYNYATAALVLWRQRCQKNIIGSHSAVNHFDFALIGNKPSSDSTLSGSFFLFI